ncbi:MAG: immunoglobulin domain-containing protein, partial [Ruminococcaceae bacterium]|nr:immunoglobulin domain-containing protein [Oscillospiraceae bacterium]
MKKSLGLILIIAMLVNLLSFGAMAVDAPKITTQPKDVSAAVGTSAKFTVAASGSGLTYQWMINKNDGNGWKNSTASSATTATLSQSVTAEKNGYQYRCVVK